MTDVNDKLLIEQQKRYYELRAPHYDEWVERRGRWDHGHEENEAWIQERDQTVKVLREAKLSGSVLDIACGTGWWTQHLISAHEITALDSSKSMLRYCGARLGTKVRLVNADVFQWAPKRRFQNIMFTFWLSHIPECKFSAFWDQIDAWLEPNGMVFFADHLFSSGNFAIDQKMPSSQASTSSRTLENGRKFEIVKVFYEPQVLRMKLSKLGWSFNIGRSARFFIWGTGRRSAELRAG